MAFQNTVITSNGEILTGKLWRKNHPFLKELPFYCDILKMDDIADSLQAAFGERSLEGVCYCALLVIR